ncbi:MAG: DUF523 and DUF1722 domain-containing protein [Bryobacterales bacterium]|nr:DUF523 and DUF1722 domain-containing protein [Bryobacterales bacterium]
MPLTPLRIGISSCLLGETVRYDGGHKRDRFLVDTLGGYVEWVPVCPELEVGMGVPRESLRLLRSDGETRLVAIKSRQDHTRVMQKWVRARLADLAKESLCGYVLKSRSPSCGMERVPIYDENGVPAKKGIGAFAGPLLERFPHLPVEEEGRLHDPKLRENFIERVFARNRLLSLFAGRWKTRNVVEFHTHHKLQLMSHSPKDYRQLGLLVATIKQEPRRVFRDQYESGFMTALRKKATRGRHANVLQHAAGYVREGIDSSSRQELSSVIEDFRQGLVPLIVPITLLRHHVRQLKVAYLENQHYLSPHPKELMLRNHV